MGAAPSGSGYHVVVAGQLETPEEAAAAFDLDWPVVQTTLEDLGCAPTGTAREAFRDELRRARVPASGRSKAASADRFGEDG